MKECYQCIHMKSCRFFAGVEQTIIGFGVFKDPSPIYSALAESCNLHETAGQAYAEELELRDHLQGIHQNHETVGEFLDRVKASIRLENVLLNNFSPDKPIKDIKVDDLYRYRNCGRKTMDEFKNLTI